MKTIFDYGNGNSIAIYGNGIKITIDETDGDIDEPLFDESQFAPCPDAADDYVDDNDYDDDDEQDEPVDFRSSHKAALDEAIKLREENIELNHKLDILRSELRRYFESHSDGSSSEAYDPDYTAQEVVNAVADVVEDW